MWLLLDPGFGNNSKLMDQSLRGMQLDTSTIKEKQ